MGGGGRSGGAGQEWVRMRMETAPDRGGRDGGRTAQARSRLEKGLEELSAPSKRRPLDRWGD